MNELNRQAKNSIIYLIGTILIAVVSFISTIVLTRVLPKQTYAQYGLLTTFVTTSVTVITLGMDKAYTRFFYESGYTPLRFLWKSARIPMIIAALFIMVLLEPKHRILTYIFETNVNTTLVVLLTGYLLFALLAKFTQLTARMGEFALNYVSSSFVEKTGFVICIFLASIFVKDISIQWVVASFLLASLFAMLINISTLYRTKRIKVKTVKAVTTKEMLSYGIPLIITNVVMLIVPLVERLVVRDLAGWTILSIYTAASVFYTVIALMKVTIDNIWHPIVFKYYKNKEFFSSFLHDFGLLVTGVTVIGLGACVLLRRWLVLILDKAYFDVFLIAPAIMFSACYEIYTLIYGIGLNTEKKTSHVLISPFIQITLSLGLCYSLIPKMGLLGVGIASMVSVAASKTYQIVMGLKLYGTGKKEWKVSVLWVLSVCVSIFVMFSTSLLSDFLVFIVLGFFSIFIINKEGIDIIKSRAKLFCLKNYKVEG